MVISPRCAGTDSKIRVPSVNETVVVPDDRVTSKVLPDTEETEPITWSPWA